MQRTSKGLRYSPQDLILYVNSEFAAWMDRFVLEYPDQAPQPSPVEEMQKALYEMGQQHERQYLQKLQAEGQDLVVIDDSDGVAATLTAMKKGHDFIYQAVLQAGDFLGYADFLIKVSDPSPGLGDWSYAPLECKLALNPRPDFILQSTCYCHLLAQIQDRHPEQFYLLLGNGQVQFFSTEQYRHYYHHVHQSFMAFMARFDPETSPIPHAGNHGHWQEECDRQLKALDHLSRVANITQLQIRRLETAGITTLSQLAASDPDLTIPKLNTGIYQRLVQQAQLQTQSTPSQIAYAIKRPEPDNPRQGLALLPPASPLDLYFDLEGYPLAEGGGLEYLFGATYEENGELCFQDWWAHDEVMEKQAFEQFIDWICDRWQADPTMHIYHYAAYEMTALKRLMGKYGTREEELDNLLRAGAFIDLFQIVRQGLCIGTTGYSIKDIEPLYDCIRQGEVKNAQASVVQYFRWQQSQESPLPKGSPLLKEIWDYNKIDCDSTKLLADWLRELQCTYDIPYLPLPEQATKAETSTSEQHQNVAKLAEEILSKISADDSSGTGRIQELLAHLLEFHRRSDKPFWWQRFEWLKAEENELFDSLDCLAGMTRTATPPYRPTAKSRSWAYEYRFDPSQEVRLAAKTPCWFAPEITPKGCTLQEIEPVQGRAVITISDQKLREQQEKNPHWQPPQRTSLIDANYIDSKALAQSIFETVTRWRDTGDLQPALRDFLERRSPRILHHTGSAIIPDSVPLLEGTIQSVANLDQSTLCIQGPPGTGKTYTAAHIILHLLKTGKTIAVSSNSHKAINNLLERIALLAQEHLIPLKGAKIQTDKTDPLFQNTTIEYQAKIDDALPPRYQLLGATPFALCKPAATGQWDYLFIDEAGQVSLANLVAIIRCAQNLVLMGDQMQLEQPIQGTHPGESGQSALGYLLNGKPTIAPELGIFLNTSYRMHPTICRFISESVYEKRLHHHTDTYYHQLHLQEQKLSLPSSGITFIPVAHEGNAQSSQEEIEVIEQLVNQILGRSYTSERGKHTASLRPEDILVVAPYNLQVRQLQARLRDRSRIGTVDKFQGQEAPVLIISMCASRGETASRGLDFLLNPNRLNVALSRAQCLSIVVGSPHLAQTGCSNIQEVKLVNLFCKVIQQQFG